MKNNIKPKLIELLYSNKNSKETILNKFLIAQGKPRKVIRPFMFMEPEDIKEKRSKEECSNGKEWIGGVNIRHQEKC